MNTFWYIANIRFPSEKANSIQVAAMSRALFDKGIKVTFVLPRRHTDILQDAYSYYGLSRRMRIVRIPVLDTTGIGRIGFLFEHLQFALLSGIYIFFRGSREDKIFAREYACCLLPLLRFKKVVWESHRGEWNTLIRILVGAGLRIVAITHAAAERYLSEGVPESSIAVLPDAADPDLFAHNDTKEACRERLGLPQDSLLAVYAGHLYSWKGAHILAEAVAFLPDEWGVLFVGGTDQDIASFKERYEANPRIRIMGRRLHAEIPYWLHAADVAVLPNTGDTELASRYMSPLKLFEYALTGTPIVASDLPSIREVLDENSAVLVEPGNPKALAEGCRRALEDLESAQTRSDAARAIGMKHTWAGRAEMLRMFFNSIPS